MNWCNANSKLFTKGIEIMRSIIYNNINESNFSYTYKRFKFYFSSEFNKTRFKEKIENFINDEVIKLNQRYKVFDKRFNEILEEILLISFYKKIEKRGFLVYDLKHSNYYKEEY